MGIGLTLYSRPYMDLFKKLNTGTVRQGADMELPIVGSEWKHNNGNLYTVLCIANEHTGQPDRYPVTVVYQGENLRIWSRPLSGWHRSMTPNG